jgi:hypothetical protein
MRRRHDAVTFSLGEHRSDVSGRLVVSARISRTGSQSYGDHDEWRPESTVFEPASLRSFEGAPVTRGHVAWIDSTNITEHARGFTRNVQRDGEHVRAELVIWDHGVISDIKAGRLVEISCGYSCDLETIDGKPTQRNVRANHVALGGRDWARCGASCSIGP